MVFSSDMISQRYFLLCFFALQGCSSSDSDSIIKSKYQKAEYIYRNHNERLLSLSPPQATTPPAYSWDQSDSSNLMKITKEHFRCKGSSLNPHRLSEVKGEVVAYSDCGGLQTHSLPIRNDKEFIYPILIELLNYIQANTQQRVIITSGHRCPEHNTYVDSSPTNQYSKHMIGAEVAFYVNGMENQPEKIVDLIQKFYQESPRYHNQKEYITFQRYDKGKVQTETLPWYNKEVFVKIFKKNEGRNLDNRHPYPYLSIQVRYDCDSNEQVNYSWEKAHRNYHRW